ncbi:MAG: glycosyltransferase [Lachnospiraceae bacterium]|nr:glycosyltransferase [Lachnospiraceae bacterium]
MNWSGTTLKKCLYIIVVSLNPGKRLKETLDSIFSQTCSDYTVIIKDGGSSDGALKELMDSDFFNGRDNVRIEIKPDKSIYDGMNQAVDIMKEQITCDMKDDKSPSYCMFLNCGDAFHDENVLAGVLPHLQAFDKPHIVYGDQYNIIQGTKVSSAPEVNEFTLFRNVPCHQVCFYDTRLFDKRSYDTKYKVRADYEHFLYSCYEEHAQCEHIDVIICDYEGGGYSETAENRKLSALEHREITDRYMGKSAARYRAIMLLTLAPVRTRLAQSKKFSVFYNSLKSRVYR